VLTWGDAEAMVCGRSYTCTGYRRIKIDVACARKCWWHCKVSVQW